jgi:hypothetical protein
MNPEATPGTIYQHTEPNSKEKRPRAMGRRRPSTWEISANGEGRGFPAVL